MRIRSMVHGFASLLCACHVGIATAQSGLPKVNSVFAFSDIGNPVTELVVQTNTGLLSFAQVGRGWWSSTGSHSDSNYGAASVDDGFGVYVYHNYFVFDVGTLGGSTVLNAYLHLWQINGGYQSADPSLIYSVWDVTSPLDQVMTDRTARLDIFTDLGSGIGYGSRSVSAADNGVFVDVLLNDAALSFLNSQPIGQALVGFGGMVTAAAPAPETWTLMLGGLGLLGLAVRRKNRNQT